MNGWRKGGRTREKTERREEPNVGEGVEQGRNLQAGKTSLLWEAWAVFTSLTPSMALELLLFLFLYLIVGDFLQKGKIRNITVGLKKFPGWFLIFLVVGPTTGNIFFFNL